MKTALASIGSFTLKEWCAGFDPARMAKDRRRYLAEACSFVPGADVEGTVATAGRVLSDGRRVRLVWFHAFVPEAADALRGMGGRYDRAAGAWSFPDDDGLSTILVELILEDLFRTSIDVDAGCARRLSGGSSSRQAPTYELLDEPVHCDLPAIVCKLMAAFDREGGNVRLFDLVGRGRPGCAFADPCRLGVGWFEGFSTRHPFVLLRLGGGDATPLTLSVDSRTGEVLAKEFLKSEGPLLAGHAASIEFFAEPVVLPSDEAVAALSDVSLLAASGFGASLF